MVSSSLTQRPHPYYNPRLSPLNHFLAALLCEFQKLRDYSYQKASRFKVSQKVKLRFSVFVFLKKSGSGNILNRTNLIWKPSGSDSQDLVKRLSLHSSYGRLS